MIQEYQLRVRPEIAANEQRLKEYLSEEKGLNLRNINATRILKRSIDARQRTIFVNLKIRVYINETPEEDEYEHTVYNSVEGKPQVIVVGAGPGGLFAALRLIELGLRPVIVERGKDVRERKKDLAQISREHMVNPESNYSFGEGGAGAYSDGKLYTRSKKRGNIDKILNVFCQHGASTAILVDAHPHIGTDKLPRVIENMRNTILECGGEVHFRTRMDALIIENNEIKGIETNTGKTFLGPVILATGHSARDVYRWLAANNVTIEAKGIAVGVRLEHPATLIDQIQYHNKNGRGKYLPAAEYSFVTQVEGRGVYSFCMCPGGFIVPAASGPEQVVVNGMSPSNRGSRWSNSGMVVEIQPEDFINEELRMESGELAAQQNEQLLALNPSLSSSQLSMFNTQLLPLHFQEELERQCWLQGGRRQTAPAQRMLDFTRKKLSYDLPESSYSPGLISSPLHFWMPEFISKRLSLGFQQFGRSSHGFLTNEAVMIGVETRTSSPVRIIRDKETLQHVTVRGLFPCGEGAGYAGGIVSAGVDGERCAEAVANYLNQSSEQEKRMNYKPEIAIIEPNTLCSLGLKSILEEIIPMATIRTFHNFNELMDDTPDMYAHYFISAQIYVEHNAFFLPRKRKTIVLASDSPQFQLSGVPVLNIYESEEKLVKNILKLHQHAHHNGYPVKDMPPMIPAEHPQVLLSAREIEVLVLITKGLINKEIADKLNISLTTVITHRKNITEKLGIKSVSGLTIYAVMNGYIEADRI